MRHGSNICRRLQGSPTGGRCPTSSASVIVATVRTAPVLLLLFTSLPLPSLFPIDFYFAAKVRPALFFNRGGERTWLSGHLGSNSSLLSICCVVLGTSMTLSELCLETFNFDLLD